MNMAIQTAVITGGASGIGKGLATALANGGARVIIADIEVDRAHEVAREIGGRAVAMPVDHADEASIAGLADACFAELGAIDAVFANAGVGAGGAIHTVPQRNLDWVLSVNLMGPIWLARHFVPRMVDADRVSRFVITGSEHSLGCRRAAGRPRPILSRNMLYSALPKRSAAIWQRRKSACRSSAPAWFQPKSGIRCAIVMNALAGRVI